MRKLIFTLSAVNAVLNLMVIGIFMPNVVITMYGMTGQAVLHGSKWFYLLYAAVPVLISGAFFAAEILHRKAEDQRSESESDGEQNAVDDFLSGHSKKSDNADMVFTWFTAVISWVMTGLALNSIEDIGVIMPSIIVVMISAFIIFTSSLSSGGDNCKICGIEVRWLDGCANALKRTKRIAALFGVMSGMVGVCLAAWSLVINNNLPNCIAVAELLLIAFAAPTVYSRVLAKKEKSK